MAVKRRKQGSRLSAFGHHTFSFQWPLMQGGIDFPLQYTSQKTGNCVQHQTFGEFDTMMVSNTGPIGNWGRARQEHGKGTSVWLRFSTAVGGVCGCAAAWHAVNPRNLGGQLVPWGSANSGEAKEAFLIS